MTYFIFNESKAPDIFANTFHVSRLGGRPWVVGQHFKETRHLEPQEMKCVFERDFRNCIREGTLPKMNFSITIEREGQIPIYRIEVLDIGEPLIFKFADESDSLINCEDSSFGRVKITPLARYIKDKIAQVFWAYNADLVSLRGIYGHTHFAYQIVFSPKLIERQAHSIKNALNKLHTQTSSNEVVRRLAA